MVQRSKAIRSKSRNKLRKKPRERGMSSITRALQQFDEGESVYIVIDTSIHKVMTSIHFKGYC